MKYHLELAGLLHVQKYIDFFQDNKIYFRSLTSRKAGIFIGAYQFEADEEDMTSFQLKFDIPLRAVCQVGFNMGLTQIKEFSTDIPFVDGELPISFSDGGFARHI
jgi:hypothetical protein